MTIRETIDETTTERMQAGPRERIVQVLRSVDVATLRRVNVDFNARGGALISAHDHDMDQVQELLRLLEVSPVSSGWHYLREGSRLVLHYGSGEDLRGGVALDWYTNAPPF